MGIIFARMITEKNPSTALKCLQAVANKSDSVIVMCSLGKDSLVTLDLCYPRFKRIVCVFMYFVKDLEHINKWIRWVQSRYPNVEFVQIPHWCLSYTLRSGLFCVPQPNVKAINLSDVIKALRLKYGIQYVMLGMKKADGMNRNLMLKTYEANDYINDGLCYPLADWNQKDILAYMKMHSMPPPVRYSLKASSGVGFNIECLKWMEENYPQDLQKFYEVFPFCERVLWEEKQKALKQS